MKRRIVCFVIFAVMMLALTSCKSRNYQEAVELFENSQYSQARTMFTDLADYEDSAAMVRECSYRLALEAMEDGDYEAAYSLFTELADFGASPEMIKKCCYHLASEAMEKKAYLQAKAYLKQAGDYQDASQKLKDFPKTVMMTVLQEQGELVYNSENPAYSVTLYPESDQKIGIRYFFTTMVEEIEQKQELTLVVTWGETEAKLKGTTTGNVLVDQDRGKTYDIWESAEGVLMLDTYRCGDKITWKKRASWCANGSYPKSVPIYLIGALAGRGDVFVERMLTGVQQILQEENLGITLADLGFASVVCE